MYLMDKNNINAVDGFLILDKKFNKLAELKIIVHGGNGKTSGFLRFFQTDKIDYSVFTSSEPSNNVSGGYSKKDSVAEKLINNAIKHYKIKVKHSDKKQAEIYKNFLPLNGLNRFILTNVFKMFFGSKIEVIEI
jgi:hypothetical protein